MKPEGVKVVYQPIYIWIIKETLSQSPRCALQQREKRNAMRDLFVGVI